MMDVFLSEVRYLAAAADDFIEIVVAAGTDVSNIQVVVYNESGTIEGKASLGVPVATMNDYDVYVLTDVDMPGSDGVYRTDSIALVDDGVVTQFIGLEGGATLATEGPAAGLTSDPVPSINSDGTLSVKSYDGTNFITEAHDEGVFTPPCFAPGTLIETDIGPRAVETLGPGDKVCVRGGPPEPILWVTSRTLRFGPKTLHHGPIEIKRGALGQGLPERDLVVSPQHRILLGGDGVEQQYDVAEVLGMAKGLLPMDGVRRMKGKAQITYHTLMLARHRVIFAEGLPVESFYPGLYILRGFPASVQAKITTLVPALATNPGQGYGPHAAPVLRRAGVEQLVKFGQAQTPACGQDRVVPVQQAGLDTFEAFVA